MTLPGSRIPVGISSCLLGREVRYDGGHKRNEGLIELGALVHWVPVCPEVEMGLPTPRPPLRLEQTGGGIRMAIPSEGRDLTEAMELFAQARVAQLMKGGLCGYVFKSRSPSCGLHDVPLFEGSDAGSHVQGRGLFAEALTSAWPSLPVEDEVSLADPAARAKFLERVFNFSDSLRP